MTTPLVPDDAPNAKSGPEPQTTSQSARAEEIGPSIDDIDTLKELTNSHVISIAGGDVVAHIQNDAKVLEEIGKKPGTYYRDIIYALMQIRLPEREAERDWREILEHKYIMSEKLGRNVGVHVSALDYYTNIKRRVFSPKILDAHEYADTASKALTDDLTRAYNRGFFMEELARLFALAKTGARTFSMILLDLDHFKAYNDINGHIRGDIALIQTVRILHAVCSQDDTVARYGGEEFVVLLPDQTLSIALSTAENIRSALYDFRFVNEQDLPGGRLSASLGVTTYRPDMAHDAELIEEADVALYRAKNGGRNRVKAFLKGE